MNTFDLEIFGVQRLESNEMLEVDGGFLRWTAEKVGEFLLKEFVEDPTQFVSSGWDSTHYGHYGGARP